MALTPRATLSAVVSVHNEEDILYDCLKCLFFADEIVVILDRCTDRSEEIAREMGAVIHPGDWDLEGDRRNAAIAACSCEWILEVDADEHVPPELAREIRETVTESTADWHEIPVDNYVGGHLVRHGWGRPSAKLLIRACLKKASKFGENSGSIRGLPGRARREPC